MVLSMDQRLVPSLKALRDEIDHLAPTRDRGADGDVGDRAHQLSTSAHNPDDTPGVRVPREDADHKPEIHALDIDSTGPWPAEKDLNWMVEIIRGRHLRGFDTRLQNLIWRGRIASRTWGWSWENRPGIGHFDHAHFEVTSEDQAEADTRPWGLLEIMKGSLVMEKLEGYALPVLHLGDNDAELEGYNRIRRIQKLLQIDVDGIYGPQTATAIKLLGVNDGRSITLPVWVALYGLTHL